MHTTPFLCSKEAHTIVFELLFVHGGVEGLAQAVRLCHDAHQAGRLRYYALPRAPPLPRTGSASAGMGGEQRQDEEEAQQQLHAHGNGSSHHAPQTAGQGVGGGEVGGVGAAAHASADVAAAGLVPSGGLVLEGDSRIQAIVVLLAWLLSIYECAR